jgi:glycosyltransferase involved in cell wall biosynthesis
MISSESPKISICIPSYNQTIYLERLLKSIRIQHFSDYEIIVSDDSTTPAVKDLVVRYDFGNRLTYFKNPASLGSPANWNAAIEKAGGKYVKLMHHDDTFADENSLGDMVSFIESNDYDYIFCNTRVENVKDPEQGRIHKIRKFTKTLKRPYLLFFGNSIGAPSTLLLKRELSFQLQYDPRYIWLVDIEYYTRLIQASRNGNFINKPLIIAYEAMEQRLTSSILQNFDLQIREHVLLYNLLAPKAGGITRFFMQVCMARLFLRAKTCNRNVIDNFYSRPGYLQIYFSILRLKPFYFIYYLLTRSLDLLRKIFIY